MSNYFIVKSHVKVLEKYDQSDKENIIDRKPLQSY